MKSADNMTPAAPEDVRYIAHTKWGSIRLVRGPDGLWRSNDGTIWAIEEPDMSVDPVTRCGVGMASLSTDNPLTKDCAAHDYMYNSRGYQAFHTRKEADEHLLAYIENDKTAGAWTLLARPFYWVARLFGGQYWENKDTND